MWIRSSGSFQASIRPTQGASTIRMDQVRSPIDPGGSLLLGCNVSGAEKLPVAVPPGWRDWSFT